MSPRHSTIAHTPTPPIPSLPRFPLPSRLRAPEKSDLVSQGLDRALARAQLVDPQFTTLLSLDEHGGDVTGLSERTIRRLRDLGITDCSQVRIISIFREKPGLNDTI
jgi:ATP-dependent RNA helicase DDX51/DBP6